MKPKLQRGSFASDLMTILLSKDGTTLFSASNGAVVALNTTYGQLVRKQSIT